MSNNPERNISGEELLARAGRIRKEIERYKDVDIRAIAKNAAREHFAEQDALSSAKEPGKQGRLGRLFARLRAGS